MTELTTAVDPRSDPFRANEAAMAALVAGNLPNARHAASQAPREGTHEH